MLWPGLVDCSTIWIAELIGHFFHVLGWQEKLFKNPPLSFMGESDRKGAFLGKLKESCFPYVN